MSEVVVCVTPSQALRDTMTELAPALKPQQILLSASKGIEEKTFLRMSQIMREFGEYRVATLGGPSFAAEVAEGMPTAITIAANDEAVGKRVQDDFNSASLRAYRNQEMTRLAIACGGSRDTMSGLSGVGDLVLTCTGGLSRNRTVGIELGKGRRLADILQSLNGKVAEGVRTTTAALGLAARDGVEMPITEQMAAILHQDRNPREAIRELMSRPGRTE